MNTHMSTYMKHDPSVIDFYFDFSSPYGYFAATRIDALAAQFQREVAWHPILLGAVFKTTGAQPLTLVPLKGDYSWRDFERTARLNGIDYARPANFPISSQSAARATLWIHAAHGQDRAKAFVMAAYRAYFVDGVDISDAEQVVALAAVGAVDDSALREGINTPEIKLQLRTATEEAIATGVFGSPFFIVDDEPFWGFDRLEQLRYFLQHGRI